MPENTEQSVSLLVQIVADPVANKQAEQAVASSVARLSQIVQQVEQQQAKVTAQSAKEVEQSTARIAALTEKRAQALIRTADESRKAFQGLVDAGKGLAVIGVISDENAEAVDRTVAKIEALANIAQGTIEIVFGLASAFDALRKAKSAAVAIEVGGDIVNGAVGAAVSSAGTKTASRDIGGHVVTGTVSVAVYAAFEKLKAGIHLVGTKLSWLGTKIAAAGSKLVAGAAVVGTFLLRFCGVIGIAIAVVEALRLILQKCGVETETMTGAIIGWRKAVAGEKKTENDLDNRVIQFAQQRKERDQGRSAELERVAAARADRRTMFAELSGYIRPEQLDPQRQFESSEIGAARTAFQRAMEKARASEQSASTTKILPDYVEAIGQGERLQEARIATLAIQKQQYSHLQQQLEAHRQLRDLALQQLNAAKEKLRVEQGQTESKLARFGKLDKEDQAEIKRILRKDSKGKPISLEEANTLSQHGFGLEIANRRFAQAGIEAGGARWVDHEQQRADSMQPLDVSTERIERAKQKVGSAKVGVRHGNDVLVALQEDIAEQAGNIQQTIEDIHKGGNTLALLRQKQLAAQELMAERLEQLTDDASNAYEFWENTAQQFVTRFNARIGEIDRRWQETLTAAGFNQ